MNFILILILSCAKQPQIDHMKARELLNSNDCLASLKAHMELAECPELRYKMLSEYDIMFRCHKPEDQRKSFWDTHVFRVSPAWIEYTGDEKKYMDDHNICIDDHIRIEAFPPILEE